MTDETKYKNLENIGHSEAAYDCDTKLVDPIGLIFNKSLFLKLSNNSS